MSLGKIFSLTQKLGPWGLLQNSKNPNYVKKIEAKLFPKRETYFSTKRSKTFEAKQSEMKRNFFSRVSRKGSETKRNRLRFALFRFEAKLF